MGHYYDFCAFSLLQHAQAVLQNPGPFFLQEDLLHRLSWEENLKDYSVKWINKSLAGKVVGWIPSADTLY